MWPLQVISWYTTQEVCDVLPFLEITLCIQPCGLWCLTIAGNYLCIWPPVVLPLLATICVYDPQWFWCLAIAGNHLCIWPPVVLMFGHCWQLLCVYQLVVLMLYHCWQPFVYMTPSGFDVWPLLATALCIWPPVVLMFRHCWQLLFVYDLQMVLMFYWCWQFGCITPSGLWCFAIAGNCSMYGP